MAIPINTYIQNLIQRLQNQYQIFFQKQVIDSPLQNFEMEVEQLSQRYIARYSIITTNNIRIQHHIDTNLL